MRKYILLCLLILVGCTNNQKLENVKIDFFNVKYEIDVKFKNNCKKDMELYFENDNEQIYFICVDNIDMKTDVEMYLSDYLKIKDIKDYFQIYNNIVYDNEMIVYVESDATNEEIDDIKNKLMQMDIAELKYVSKEDYYNEMIEYLPDSSDIDFDYDYILSYFAINVNDVTKMKEYANIIEKIDKVNSVDYASNEEYDVSGSLIDSFINVIKDNNKYSDKNNIIKSGNLKFISCTKNNKNILYISHINNKNVDNICK